MLQVLRGVAGITNYCCYGWNDISNETVGAVEALIHVDLSAFYVAANKRYRHRHRSLNR